MSAELAVVGAGPAGLAAAFAAAEAGVTVHLLDSAATIGGQLHRQKARGGHDAVVASAAALDGLPGKLGRLAPFALTPGRLTFHPRTEVWHVEADGGSVRLYLHHVARDGADERPAEGSDGGGDLTVLEARALVLATGASELVLPFPGWELPGVTTAGGAQALAKAHGVAVGRRVIVAGSGPFLLPVAATLLGIGCEVAAVVEARAGRSAAPLLPRLGAHPAKLGEASRYALALARNRVPLLSGCAVTSCGGEGALEEAVVDAVDEQWRPVAGGRRRRLAADAVCVSFGFVPRLELARQLGLAERPDRERPLRAVWHDESMATSMAGVFAAGEVTGIGGGDVAALEGGLAGRSAAAYLGHGELERKRRVRGGGAGALSLERARGFASLLERLYPLGRGWSAWLTDDTVICRCEEVSFAAVAAALDAGASDVRAVRATTRCGMGYCQGRTCGPALQLLAAAASGRPLESVGDLDSRPVTTPVELGALSKLLDRS